MTKNQIRGCIFLVVILTVLSVIAFAVPFAKTAVFWLAYIFATVAILFQIYVYKVSHIDSNEVKSRFYGFPIAKVGLIYLIVQLLISLVEMITAAFLPIWVALVINVLPIALAIIGCIAAETIRDEIVEQDIKLKTNLNNMRNLQSMSVTLVGLCANEETKKIMQNVADEFKYSDPVSSEQTQNIESELQSQMNEIQKAIVDEDDEAVKVLGKRILVSLTERNRVCRLNK